jgi:hypothetical protein
MKVRIKTAHGYLSFQPDGRLEYRDAAGAWEELDIEGLTFEPAPAPGQPDAPPEPAPPPELIATPSAAYVAAVRAECLAAGLDLSGPCGAFQITKRVAWGLRGAGIGLVSKSSGNNCDGYSVDFLCWKGGDGVDVLGDAGGMNLPQWSDRPREFVGQDRWRMPVQP